MVELLNQYCKIVLSIMIIIFILYTVYIHNTFQAVRFSQDLSKPCWAWRCSLLQMCPGRLVKIISTISAYPIWVHRIQCLPLQTKSSLINTHLGSAWLCALSAKAVKQRDKRNLNRSKKPRAYKAKHIWQCCKHPKPLKGIALAIPHHAGNQFWHLLTTSWCWAAHGSIA